MHKILQELRSTLRLAIPMIIGQLAIHSLHIIDTAMIGRVGVTEVAAAAFAGSIFGMPLLFGFGLATALTILVAQAYGAEDLSQARGILRHGIFLGIVYGFLAFGLFGLTQPLWIDLLGQPEAVVREAGPYLTLLMGSLPVIVVFQSLKNYCEAQDRPWLPLFFLILAVFLNVFLNWLLIFGNWGFPALGLVGAGWATLIARILVSLGFWIYLVTRTPLLRGQTLFRLNSLDWRIIREYLAVGLPIGLQISFEVFIFNFAAIMMGWIGTVTLAAHHIALNLAALSFMLPLGLSFAVGIRVSQAAGGKRWDQLRRSGLSNFGLAGFAMALMAIFFLLSRHFLPTLFLGSDVENYEAVVTLAAQFLIVASIFQIGDGVQVVAIGALRGLKDVRVPTALVFFAFWVICIPLGIFLAFQVDASSRVLGISWEFLGDHRMGMGWGGIGIWIGMAVGLCLNAVILTLRFIWITRPGRLQSVVR